MSTPCLFCKIIAGEIPSTKVYEDKTILAFLDLYPTMPGHILIVPKVHMATFDEADPDVLKDWILVAQRLARAVKKGLSVDGFNLFQNNGTVAGQVIPHLHLHLIPRRPNDGLMPWPSGAYASSEEMQRIADAIRQTVKMTNLFDA